MVADDSYKNIGDEVQRPKIEVTEGADINNNFHIFIINDEDHTLGNSLSTIIKSDPAVVHAGYTVGHPMDRKIELRIQTNGSADAMQVLKRSLQQLKKQTQEAKDMLKAEVARYTAEHPGCLQ